MLVDIEETVNERGKDKVVNWSMKLDSKRIKGEKKGESKA